MLIALSSNKGSVELAHMRRLARAFISRIYKIWVHMKTETQIQTPPPLWLRQDTS